MTAGWRPVARLVRRQVAADATRTSLVVGLVALATAILVLTTGVPWAGSVGPLLLGLAAMVELSALAIGDRDRLQTLALLEVAGARPRLQPMLIILHGCVLGALGTCLGVAVGVALRYVLSVVDRGHAVQAALGVVDVMAVVFAGLFTSFAAAVLAGLGARRTPIRSGLAGRRPSSPPRRTWLVAGLSLVAAGTWVAGLSRTWVDMFLTVSFGGLLFMVGSVMIAVLALGRIDVVTRRAGGVWHQAGLGLARQRYRIGPVVAVLTVALGAATVGAVFGRSFGEREHRRQQLIARYLTATPLPAGLVRIDGDVTSADRDPVTEVRRILPHARRFELRVLGLQEHALRAEANRSVKELPDDIPREVVVGDAQLLRSIGLGGLGDELAAGRAIALAPVFVDRSPAAGSTSHGRGHVTLAGEGIAPIRIAAVSARRASSRLPAVVISEKVARRLGLDTVARVTLFDNGRPFTGAQDAALHDPTQVTDFTLFEESKISIGGDPPDRSRHDLAGGPFIQTDRHAQRAVVITIGGLGLLTIIAALTLVSLDRRRDDQLLVVLGADRRYLRALGALQAWLLATVAAVVASPLGLAGTAVGFAMYNRRSRGTLPPIPFVLPLDAIAVFVVVLPLVAAAGTWLLTADVDRVDLPRLAD